MPDTTIAIAIMLGSFVLLLMARMPISFTLGISSVLTALYLNIPLATLFQRMVSGVQSFSLLAIPFFILAGEIMGQGGISRRLITLANACVGWMRGGLAQVNILASMFFGGISGSAVADTSSIGSILIPMMTDSRPVPTCGGILSVSPRVPRSAPRQTCSTSRVRIGASRR